MRLGKIQVVFLALVCLSLAIPAPAQLGKLKSMVKDKMGPASKPESKVQDVAKGTPGEAKASLAPGVQKGVNVKRQGGGTPEASVVSASAGRSQTLTVKLSGVDARQFDSVRAYAPCNKISNFVILSASQVKVTLDLTGAKSGSCQLFFRTGSSTVFSSNVAIR